MSNHSRASTISFCSNIVDIELHRPRCLLDRHAFFAAPFHRAEPLASGSYESGMMSAGSRFSKSSPMRMTSAAWRFEALSAFLS